MRCGTTPRDRRRVSEAGVDRAAVEAVLRRFDGWTRGVGDRRPMFAGAVALLVHDGVLVTRTAVGHAVRYADGAGTELPTDRWTPMRPDTIFDLASVSKLFTSIVAMQLVERGAVALDAPVARHLPEFAANGKAGVTVTQLLTHTSGLRPWLPLWRDRRVRAGPPSRLAAVLADPPTAAPGTRYDYSDLNMITLGVLAERVAGTTLDVLVRDGVTGPLRLRDTGYRPARTAPTRVDRIAATEYQADPPRGMVRGQVHDENAWALGGVAGHAGVFSTADDLAVLGQAFLDGGGGILAARTVAAMLTDHNRGFPSDPHGLGFDLDRPSYMGVLAGQGTVGHTGFTGTSIVIAPATRSVVVLLTNRVHPSRHWASVDPARRALAAAVGAARPSTG